MSSAMQNQFVPNYAIPPGETLLDTLESLGMSQKELAARTGRPRKTINEIVKGKAAITPETALQFERVLGVPAGFWNNLERNYQETLARLAERERLEKQVAWLKEIHASDLIKAGWIRPFKDKVEQLQEALNFFGVATPELLQEKWRSTEIAYRESQVFKSHPGAVAAWLRKGELLAKQIACKPFDAARFKGVLSEIRALTATPPTVFQPEIIRLCADAGVAVAFVPELPKTRVSGATWWLGDKAIIQLSLRYKTDDHLWFSFFHEAGHILLHGKKEVFIEVDHPANNKEQQANEFAAEMLIPRKELQRFVQSQRISKVAIKQFAEEIGIAPGIVVGRLQHEGLLPRTHCNDLKLRLEWKAEPASGQ